MSYFFNEGISFLRDVEKNTRKTADSLHKMIEKKEHPDCDFRIVQGTVFNMLSGLLEAAKQAELVHYQSQKDRRSEDVSYLQIKANQAADRLEKRMQAENLKISDDMPIWENPYRKKINEECDTWWRAAEADTPRKAGMAMLNCRWCGCIIRNGEKYFDSNDFQCVHGDGTELSHGTSTCPRCYARRVRNEERRARHKDPNFDPDLLYCADCGNTIHTKHHYWDGNTQRYREGDRTDWRPGRRVRCCTCYEAYLGIGREIVKARDQEKKEPDNNRVIPDPMCCLCFTPFHGG